MTANCPRCGQPLAGTSSFCATCGQKNLSFPTPSHSPIPGEPADLPPDRLWVARRNSRALITLTAVMLLAFWLAWGTEGWMRPKDAAVVLSVLGLVTLLALVQFFRPATVTIHQGWIRFGRGRNAPSSRPENIAVLDFSGGLGVRFHDVTGVRPTAFARQSQGKLARLGSYHVLLPNFTPSQVEEIRATLGSVVRLEANVAHEVAEFWRQAPVHASRPYVTFALVALNVAAYVAMAASGGNFANPSVDTLLKWGGNNPLLATEGEWWRLFTCMFLHADPLHLACNMIALVQVGRMLERLIGPVAFIMLYLLSGLAGSLASIACADAVVAIGASGAVFGCFGAFFAALWRRKSGLPPRALQSLRNSAAAFVVYNLVGGFLMTGIDNAAHIGGLVAGFLSGLVVGGPTRRRWRTVAVAVAGAVGAVVVAAWLPQWVATRPLFPARVRQLELREQSLLDTFNRLNASYHARQLSANEFGVALEDEVVPGYRMLAEQSCSFPPPRSAEQRDILHRLQTYLAKRSRAMEALVRACRHNDRAADAEFRRLMRETSQP